MTKVQQLNGAREGNGAIKNLTQKTIDFINGNKRFAKQLNALISSKENGLNSMSVEEIKIERDDLANCFPHLKIWGIWPIYSFLDMIDSELEDVGGSDAAIIMVNEVRTKLEAIEETLERLEGEARHIKAPVTEPSQKDSSGA